MRTTNLNIIFFTFAFSLFTFSLSFAQVSFKNGTDNVLLQVNDYGATGTVTLPPFAIFPILPINSNMLLNFDGTLYWNGSALGTSNNAGGWTHSGTKIYNTTLTDNVGIGTSTPSAGLHVKNSDGVLFEGLIFSGSIPKEGSGTRMMWYPQKSAFRVGTISADQWNDNKIGINSTAMGSSTTASGKYSTAMGSLTTASGEYSTAMGSSIKAEAKYAIAVGSYNIGGGDPLNVVSTDPIFEIGIGTSNENRANAMTVLKNGNVGIGDDVPPHKLQVVSSASGAAVAEFVNTTSNGDGIRIKIGPNVNPTTTNDYLFFLDGDATAIGSVEGNGSGGVSYNTTSDARLKMNIKEYSNALNVLSNIGIKKYERISNPGIEEIGVIAQELQKVYPQAVSGSPDSDVKTDPMMVDYSKLTPLLVKAVQEQQETIKKLEDKLSKIESLLERKRFTTVSN